MQLDAYVERRLRGLLKRGGSRLPTGRAQAWRRPFFAALRLVRLRSTIRYPEGGACRDPEVHLLSRVRGIRTHGRNGVLLPAGRFPPTGAK